MEVKKIYYCEDEGEFYEIKKMPKTITIDWIPHLNCDGSELDQNVNHKNLRVRKDNSGKHKFFKSDGVLIYPFQNGQPFQLYPATAEDCDFEIQSCKKWGVSSEYYQEIKNKLKECEKTL